MTKFLGKFTEAISVRPDGSQLQLGDTMLEVDTKGRAINRRVWTGSFWKILPPSKQWNHTHNGLLGRAAMAKACVQAIASANSTTQDTKAFAWKVWQDLQTLNQMIRSQRVNPDGTVTTFNRSTEND